MSRADELRRTASDISQPTMAFWRDVALTAIAAVDDLESDLAARDEWIAELMETRIDMAAAAADYDRARAEVPKWCQEFVRKVYDSFVVGEYGGFKVDKSGIVDACHMLTAARLSACGIEVP